MFRYAVEETDANDFVMNEHGDVEVGSSVRACETVASLSDTNDGSPNVWSVDESVLDNVISVDGLSAMICSFFGGIGEFSQADVEQLFAHGKFCLIS